MAPGHGPVPDERSSALLRDDQTLLTEQLDGRPDDGQRAQILRGEFIQRGPLRARGQATALDQSVLPLSPQWNQLRLGFDKPKPDHSQAASSVDSPRPRHA